MTQEITAKDWEKDYTAEERREIVKNKIAYAIIKSIKEKTSPLLEATTYPNLVGTNARGETNNSNIAYNGFNGVAFEGINMLLLDTEKKEKGYATNIWLNGKQAMMLGVNGEKLKGLDGVVIQQIKTMEYEAQYLLDEKGNKIPVLDENKNHKKSRNGEPLYHRVKEKIPLKDENGNYLKDENGEQKYLMKEDGTPLMQFAPDIPKYFYETTKVKMKDKDGNVIKDENGNPRMKEVAVTKDVTMKDKDGNVLMDKDNKPIIVKQKNWLRDAILETTKVYNIHTLANTFDKEKDKDKFYERLSSLKTEPKHYNSHSEVKTLEKGAVNEIRLNELSSINVKTKDGTIKDYGLDDNTLRAINRYFFARREKVDFNQPLKPLSKEERIKMETEKVADRLNKKAETSTDIMDTINKKPQDENDKNVLNTIEHQTGKPAKSASKAPKAKTKEATKEQGRGR